MLQVNVCICMSIKVVKLGMFLWMHVIVSFVYEINYSSLYELERNVAYDMNSYNAYTS